jgi:YesN/AraC family two-component response regulator
MFIRYKPDIVFLDINLPDKDGLTILQELLDLGDHAYVIMVSGDSTFENVKESITLGAKGFIAKPFSGNKFLNAIDRMEKNNE